MYSKDIQNQCCGLAKVITLWSMTLTPTGTKEPYPLIRNMECDGDVSSVCVVKFGMINIQHIFRNGARLLCELVYQTLSNVKQRR